MKRKRSPEGLGRRGGRAGEGKRRRLMEGGSEGYEGLGVCN